MKNIFDIIFDNYFTCVLFGTYIAIFYWYQTNLISDDCFILSHIIIVATFAILRKIGK